MQPRNRRIAVNIHHSPSGPPQAETFKCYVRVLLADEPAPVTQITCKSATSGVIKMKIVQDGFTRPISRKWTGCDAAIHAQTHFDTVNLSGNATAKANCVPYSAVPLNVQAKPSGSCMETAEFEVRVAAWKLQLSFWVDISRRAEKRAACFIMVL
jgi:hypothetical protein